MHSSLTLMYGVDANFDFLAFQIRYTYLCAAQVNRNNQQQPFTINHNAVRNGLKLSVDQAQGTFDAIIPDLQEALDFSMAENPALLTPQEQQNILQLLAHLSTAEQQDLVPTIPKLGPRPAETRRRKLACMCKILQMFLSHYTSDLDSDASYRFVDVSGTPAYKFACRTIKYVNEGKIYRRHAPRGGAENAAGKWVITGLCGLDPNIYWVS